ncbi:MAG: DUF4157 domain-containing protein [Bryobacteraceae bacterium]
MTRGLSQLFSKRDPGLLAAPESVARGNASRFPTGAMLQAPAARGPAPQTEQPVFGAPGRTLNGDEKADMEPRFQRDFSNVRVHTDSPEAQSIGARAFAAGNDIAFAPGESPGTPSGRALLAHEITHTLQQSATQQAQVQMDPKNASGGIGSAPPAEPFEVASGRALEDSAVLFALDSAALTPAASKSLKKLAEHYKEAVTVRVHAYASSEGAGDYNLNLSAHRAAAVKAYMESMLPKGSRVVLFAHGQTTAFGAAEENRRAGLAITVGVEDANAAKQDKDKDQEDGWTLDPTGGQKPKPLDLFPWRQKDFKLDSQPYGPQPLSPARVFLTPPPLLRPLVPSLSMRDVDWESMQGSFRSRGLSLDLRWGDSIETHFQYSYNWFRVILPHDLSVKAANIATGFVLDDQLSRSSPNAIDRSNQEFKFFYPDEKHLVLPVLSSDILNGIYKWVSGKERNIGRF